MRGNRSEKPEAWRCERTMTSKAISTTDRRFHLPVAPEAGDRVRLEPARHLRDLGVGQAAVGLADVDEAIGRRVADGERVVAQDPVSLAMAHLHPDHDAVDRCQGLLHLQPTETAPTGHVDARRVLDHQALVPACARVGERRTRARRRRPPPTRCERANRPPPIGHREVDARPAGRRRSAERHAEERLDRRAPSTGTQRQGVERDVDDRAPPPGSPRDGAFRPSRRLERDERQDHAVPPGQDLAVEDPVPRRAVSRPPRTSGNWSLTSWRSRE